MCLGSWMAMGTIIVYLGGTPVLTQPCVRLCTTPMSHTGRGGNGVGEGGPSPSPSPIPRWEKFASPSPFPRGSPFREDPHGDFLFANILLHLDHENYST